MTRGDQADVNDRHVLREALEALARGAKRFLAVIPTGAISHGDAVDLTADADELLDQLHRLTRAQRAGDQMTDAELAERASRYLGVAVTVETVDAQDLAARAPAFPAPDNDPNDASGT